MLDQWSVKAIERPSVARFNLEQETLGTCKDLIMTQSVDFTSQADFRNPAAAKSGR